MGDSEKSPGQPVNFVEAVASWGIAREGGEEYGNYSYSE
jgi:hypothetical protein